jgi:hypothetical protein
MVRYKLEAQKGKIKVERMDVSYLANWGNDIT